MSSDFRLAERPSEASACSGASPARTRPWLVRRRIACSCTARAAARGCVTWKADERSEMAEKTAKVQKSDEEWRARLTPEQYEVTRKAGTERAFTGPYVDEK